MASTVGTTRLKLALAQLNPVVGDLSRNADLVIAAAQKAAESGADLVLFPELVISGYPPEDLVLRSDFLNETLVQLERVAEAVPELTLLVGHPQPVPEGVANALSVIEDGKVVATYQKRLLPNYGVFDERRYFVAGERPLIVERGDLKIGLTVCEDIWPEGPVLASLADSGVDLIVNASASPYQVGKPSDREEMLRAHAQRLGTPIAYCNVVGGQDELVFDGGSVVIGADGSVLARAPQFVEHELLAEVPAMAPSDEAPPSPRLAPGEHELYAAVVTGIRDYVEKNGFPGVIVGNSGGIDSAMVLALAADALGPERVTAVTMPSPYNSPETLADAHEIVRRLGCHSHELPIARLMEGFDATLAPVFEGLAADTTEENIQARIRGTLVMAISNKSGAVVLTTGNKSELAVGYATLYGDMAGAFAPLKDVLKHHVFRLARWRNRHSPDGSKCTAEDPIPDSIIERPPSAELKPGQRDETTLGSYEDLDSVIEQYVEQDLGIEAIVASGLDREYALRIMRLIDRAEFKRRQAPPGVKVSRRAFGRERRMPITARRSHTDLR
jgi:NAD+ synthetase